MGPWTLGGALVPRVDQVPRLLGFLDAVVHADSAPPGFSGSICVGVRCGANGVSWWCAEFGGRATARFELCLPEVFDVAVGFSSEEAETLMRGGTPSGAGALVGDRRIFDRFLARYLRAHTSWLGIQAGRVT